MRWDTPSGTVRKKKKERREQDKGRETMGLPRALRRQTSLPAHNPTAFLMRIQRQGRAQTPGAEAEAAKVDAGELRADLRRRGGPGAAVDFTIRQLLKPHLRFDPVMARLHRSPAAAGAARQLRADAFTIGADVFFGAEQPEAHTRAGIGLLAHELTHVGQQMGAVGGRMRFFTPSGGDEMEREAQQTARRVTDSLPLSGPLHQGAFPARPALHFALPPQVQTFETEPPPSQTATAPRLGDAKPLLPVKRANARAVTDRVYELMQQEVALNRMRGGGLRWS